MALADAFREAALVALPEELLFRGLVQGEIRARTGSSPIAVAAGAALFALAHVAAGAGAPGLLTVFPGLLFGILRALSGSVWTAVAAHAVANTLWAAWVQTAGPLVSLTL